MAKPGEGARMEMQRLAAMSRRAHDLGGATQPPPKMRDDIMRAAEMQLGARCAGCGERIRMGLRFTRIVVSIEDGKPAVDTMVVSTCDGSGGCDFAMRVREDATVMEVIEFAWLDEAEDPQEGAQADARRERAGG